MKRILWIIVAISFIGAVDLSAGIQAVIDFESLSAGTSWGAPATAPGTRIFTDSGIDVTINEFHLAGGAMSYDFARVDAAGTGQNMRVNNVVLSFDLAGMPRPVKSVMIEYVDLGGSANIGVNGGTIATGTLSTLPSSIAPGVLLFVTRTPVAGGVRGRIILLGNITSLTIGGQELWIDNVTVRDCE